MKKYINKLTLINDDVIYRPSVRMYYKWLFFFNIYTEYYIRTVKINDEETQYFLADMESPEDGATFDDEQTAVTALNKATDQYIKYNRTIKTEEIIEL